MAQPQKIIPTPMNTEVKMAGVDWKWMKVYRITPVRKTGTDTKKPPTAHTLDTEDCRRYLLILSSPLGDLASLMAKMNCAAQMRRQLRSRESVRAASASVTSCTLSASCGSGVSSTRKVSASSASRSEVRHSRPSEVSAPREPVERVSVMKRGMSPAERLLARVALDRSAGGMGDRCEMCDRSVRCEWSRDWSRPVVRVTVVVPGLTEPELPPTECFDDDRELMLSAGGWRPPATPFTFTLSAPGEPACGGCGPWWWWCTPGKVPLPAPGAAPPPWERRPSRVSVPWEVPLGGAAAGAGLPATVSMCLSIEPSRGPGGIRNAGVGVGTASPYRGRRPRLGRRGGSLMGGASG